MELLHKIDSLYGIIFDGWSDKADIYMMQEIFTKADEFFSAFTLSVWKDIGITPSQDCIDIYNMIYSECENKPKNLTELQNMVNNAIDIDKSDKFTYLDYIINIDITESKNDSQDELSMFFEALSSGSQDEIEKLDKNMPYSIKFINDACLFSKLIAEVLQYPCPADTEGKIIKYWENIREYCLNRGVNIPLMAQLKPLIQLNQIEDNEKLERIPNIINCEPTHEDKEKKDRLNDINTQEKYLEDNERKEREEETLESLLDELNSLCGMDNAKKEVQNQIAFVRMQKIRKEKGKNVDAMSMHMAFLGNPGTGKTTVARLIGRLYRAIGVLSEGQLIEVDRSGLVAEYIGHTEPKTQTVINRALGGVLFIDEAYSLANRGENDFGRAAIEVMLKNMEDKRENFVVIVAGYPEEMKQFICSNPGLESRFKNIISFEDYNGLELAEIFFTFCKNGDFTLEPEVQEYAKSIFEQIYQKRGQNFGNAREVRNFYENALISKSLREISVLDDECDDEITKEDLMYALDKSMKSLLS